MSFSDLLFIDNSPDDNNLYFTYKNSFFFMDLNYIEYQNILLLLIT